MVSRWPSVLLKKLTLGLNFSLDRHIFSILRPRKLYVQLWFCAFFDYSIASWYGGIPKLMVKTLQTAQNKVIRFILSKDVRAHIHEEDFCNLNIPNIHNRGKQLRLNHVLTFSMRLVQNILGQILQEFLIFITTGLHIVFNKISKFIKLPLSAQALFIKMLFVIGPVYQVQSSQ